MYSNKKSFVTGMVVLYLLLCLYEFWCIDDLNEQLNDVEDRIVFIELQMTNLEHGYPLNLLQNLMLKRKVGLLQILWVQELLEMLGFIIFHQEILIKT